MLSAMPGYITDPTSQEYLGAYAYGLIIRVVEKRGELPCRRVVGISQFWLQHPHISIEGPIGEVSYAQLKSGKIEVEGQEVATASLSSYPKAVEIAQILKEWIQKGEFLLSEPVAPLPGVESGITFRNLEERSIEEL